VKRMWPILRHGYENLLSTGWGEEKCSTGGRTRVKLQILYSCTRCFPPKFCTYFIFLTCPAHPKHLALRHTTQQSSVSITTAANPRLITCSWLQAAITAGILRFSVHRVTIALNGIFASCLLLTERRNIVCLSLQLKSSKQTSG
jgi:hypothetical protein